MTKDANIESPATEPVPPSPQRGLGNATAIFGMAVALVLLGAVVMFGWHVHSAALIQLHPKFTPMKYNTALCFLLGGAGLLAWGRGYYRAFLPLGLVVGAVGLLTSAQYVWNTDFGIDELFVRAYITTQSTHPGRISPVTAGTFGILGIAMVALGACRRQAWARAVAGILSSAAMGLSALAILGYFTGLAATLGWDLLSRMALHTAAGLLTFGTGMLLVTWREETLATGRSPRWLSVSTSAAAFSATLILWQALVLRENEELKLGVQANATIAENSITAALDAEMEVLAHMARRWEHAAQPAREAWEADAIRHVRESDDYESIAWLDEELAVEWIIPGGGDTVEIGRQRATIQQVREAGRGRFRQPVALARGGTGLLAFIPIYQDETGDFAGMLIAVIRLQRLLDAALVGRLPEGYHITLAAGGNDFYRSPGGDAAAPAPAEWTVEVPVALHQAEWTARVAPGAEVLSSRRSHFSETILIIGGLASVLLGLTVHLIQSATARSRQLAAAYGNLQREIEERRETQARLAETNARLEIEAAERRRSDEALRFTQFSMDNASDAIFRVARDGHLLYVNASTCKLLGHTTEELARMGVPEILPEFRKGGWEAYWNSLRVGHHRTFETEFRAKGGDLIPIELTVTFFNFAGEDVLCASARDVTVRRRILAELSTARDVAFESVRSKSRFLATMSHEIRTPMNGVIGMAELLLHTNLTIDQREYVDTIRNSADLLLNIINDILDSSKIESDSPNFQTADFDLGAVIDGTLDIVGGLARKKSLELASYTGHDVFPYLRGDSGRLRQVLTNLLGNAIKFTHQGEVVLTVSRIAETDTRTELRFEVKDTGIGIAPDVSPRIFEPFVQADGSAARQYGGTGLGLSICRQIVEALGGKIGVESAPGEGSRFWFTLGFEKQAEPIIAATTTVDVPVGLRVLVVDDNETNRRILQLQLANLGLRSSGVGGGEEALQLLRGARAAGDPCDIAILDMQMPDTDGLTLARRIKAEAAIRGTRLILLSSLGEQPAAAALTAAGVEGHLFKPLKQSRLQAALATVLPATALPSQPSVPPAPRPVTAAATVPVKRPPRHALRILVAEDNAVNQKVILLQLQHLGYAADLADDGNAALQLLEQKPYDLILMDCQMPVMDGYTATREIRRKYTRHVHIIAMTANAMQGDREKCLRSGMDDFLSKPISPPDLARVLEQCATIPDDAAGPPAPPAASSTEDTVEAVAAPLPAPSLPEPAPEAPAAEPAKSTAPPVEIARLLDITGHDDGMLRQISRDYLLQAEEILSHIYLAIERRDPAELRRLAHKLCGSSSTCGMTGIVPPLERLERMGDVPHFAIASELHQEAVHQLSRIRRFLTAHLATAST